jgi:hypothetical protein
MKEEQFKAIYRELIDENPFAIRAVLKVLCVQFTTAVPTLAVTVEERPRMLVNLDFVAAHCQNDAEVKAVICHEFLHILLRHTERFDRLDPAEHVALDAVINAIIHRQLGGEYSAMMARYYADVDGVKCLLRRRTMGELHGKVRVTTMLHNAWKGLYSGSLVADDIADLARDLTDAQAMAPGILLGGHSGEGNSLDAGQPLPPVLEEALGRVMKAMNGSGIWRSPSGRGIGASGYACAFAEADADVEKWRRETFALLRRHLLPDPTAAYHERHAFQFALPVLSPGDRRASLRALWSPFLPEAVWCSEKPDRGASAQVYLDVSGSMNAEMPLIIALLGRLSRVIRRPFWAFSDVVAPARITRGQLETETTGGTSMRCVLEHLARTRPAKAVVVTDGHIERLDRAEMGHVQATRLHAIVTRDGNPQLLRQAGINYTQLGRIPA